MNYVYLSIFLGVALLIVSVLLVMCYNTPPQMTNDQVRTAMLNDLKSNPNITPDIVSFMMKDSPTLINAVYNVKSLRTLLQNMLSDKQCPPYSGGSIGPFLDCSRFFKTAGAFEQQVITEFFLLIAKGIINAQKN